MMLPSREEARQALKGAWSLFLGRDDALRHFDLGFEGFWRSFGAIWLILPPFALTALSERQIRIAEYGGLDDGSFAASKLIALGLDWVTMPILLALLATRLGISRSYAGYVVTRNWGSLLIMLPYGFVGLLFGLGLIGRDVAGLMSLAVLVMALRYHFIIARRVLRVGLGLAIALVAVDLVVSLAIGSNIDRLFGL